MADVENSEGSLGGSPLAADRLDSWKEIASHLRRSERTVRRWEQTLHLPVHRLVNAKRATVFALKSELDDWWQAFGHIAQEKVAVDIPLAQPQPRIRLWLAMSLAAAVLLLAIAGLALRTPQPLKPVWKQVTFDTGSTTEPAISADGKLLVYSSDRSGRGDEDIYLQNLAGGPPARLTDHEARDCRPDISPDGSLVVYHSYRDAGTLYTVAASGGKEQRLAAGDYPRFSPDGGRIAFENELPDGTLAVFVIPASGGPVRRITAPMFRSARTPLWSPDGKSILFNGSTHARPQEDDWWATPADGGDPVRSGVSASLVRQGLPGLRFFHSPLDWAGERVAFVYAASGSPRLWWVPLSPRSYQVAGPAEPLTWGAGMETHLRVAVVPGKKKLAVVAAGSLESHLWEFSIDPERGAVRNQGRKLTRDTSVVAGLLATRPSLSASGELLAYASRRGGNYDVWLQDLKSGAERTLAAGSRDEVHPLLARDGSAVVFMRQEGTRQPLILVSIDGTRQRQVCDDCGVPVDWSPGDRRILYVSRAETLGLLDLDSGIRSQLPSNVPVLSGAFSPDGRTVAVGARLGATERAYLLPFEGDRWPPQQSWAPLSELPTSAVTWSPGGRMAYFLSIEDEYRCLWARKFDPATRRTLGPAFAVRHFHSAAQYPKMSRWFAIARDKLVLRLTQERGNIWSTELN